MATDFDIGCELMGLPMLDMWVGVNGEYRVPPAISWLGRQADITAGLRSRAYQTTQEKLSSPYFKVIQEWGQWRDGH